MRRLSFACEKNSDHPACLSTLGRLNLPCMTPVRAERVPVARRLLGFTSSPGNESSRVLERPAVLSIRLSARAGCP
jgi:hypothetical protein